MRKVEELPLKRSAETNKAKVAAYARVSTGKDAMLHSLSAQVSYYSRLIQQRADWEYVGIYADEGISGTKENRENFQRMLEDAKLRKIDLILTKSISRFARNTLLLLETVRELKDLGIAVYFEREKINSLTADGELMLSLLASFAQEECLSARENSRWSIKKRFEKGEIVGMAHLYGYDYIDGKLVINDEEAEIVRMIYRDYLSGMQSGEIIEKLNALGIRKKLGGKWKPNDIARFFNEKHTGSALLQKTFKDDDVCAKTHINRGEKDFYLAEDTHEGIIDKETYKAVREEVKRRTSNKNPPKSIPKYPFRGMIRCGYCGANFQRKKTKTEVFWRCAANLGQKDYKCSMKGVPERILEELTIKALHLTEFDSDIFREKVKEIIIPEANKVRMILTNGKENEYSWQDRSRSESWTAEMRAEAARKNLERYKK
ncbi:MAG: recombinase family protein [Syntrophomonadaceae bacterium]